MKEKEGRAGEKGYQYRKEKKKKKKLRWKKTLTDEWKKEDKQVRQQSGSYILS